MSFYQDVKEGNVRATMVLAVPRSASSMLGRALSGSPDIDAQIFQPFYNENDKKDDLDKKIAEARATLNIPPTQPLRIVTKIMAESLSGQHFHHLRHHCDHVVVLLRDPQSQALSTYRALWQKQAGKCVNDEEISALQTMRLNSHGNVLSPYLITPWKRMKTHVAQLQSEENLLHAPNQWCVVDGDVLRATAETSLRHLCHLMDMRYDPTMIKGWQNTEEKTVGLKEAKYPSSWLGRVQNTHGIKAPTAMTPRLEDFSPSVRKQVEANLKTYVAILASNAQAAPSPSQMRGMIRCKFARTSPIACYTLVALWPEKESDSREETLLKLRERMPEYASSYAIIDATVAQLRRHGKVDDSSLYTQEDQRQSHAQKARRSNATQSR